MNKLFASLTICASFLVPVFFRDIQACEVALASFQQGKECTLGFPHTEAIEPIDPVHSKGDAARDRALENSFREVYGIVTPSQEQISSWRKELLRKEQAALYLKKTRIVPVSPQYIDALIYLQDSLEWERPTASQIVTALNLLGLESIILREAET